MATDSIARMRAYIDNHLYDYDVNSALWVDVSEILNEIADEIEAQYLKLPTDANGVSIKPGDKMMLTPSRIVEVVAVDYSRYFYVSCLADGSAVYEWRWAEHYHHAETDTVKEIIFEAMQHAFSAPHQGETLDMSDKVAEYAERIRRAVENG